MKMPRPTYFPMLAKQPNDFFGLQHLSLLAQVCETEPERRRRVEKVEAGVAKAFRAAVHHLGENEAREIFCASCDDLSAAQARCSHQTGMLAY